MCLCCEAQSFIPRTLHWSLWTTSLWILKLFFHYCRPETLKSGQMLHCCSLKHFLLGIQTSMPLKWIVKFRDNLKNSMYVFHVAELLMASALSGSGVCLSCPPLSACALPTRWQAIQILHSSRDLSSLVPSAAAWACSALFCSHHLFWNIWLL